MRQLPVLLLVVAALGIFYLAFPFGEDAPVTAPILPPAGPNGPAVTVQDDGPVDLQRPTQDDGLAEVAAAVDRQRVDTPHAILANSVSGRVVAGGKGVQGATVTLTKFGRMASLFGPVTGNQREEDRVEETNENGEFVFRNVETYTELSLIAKHPKLGRKEEGNIQIAEGEARKGLVIILGDGVRLHGRVSDSSGNPIIGASLLLGMASLGAISDDDSPDTLSSTSSADGSYEFASVDNGNYSMTVQAKGYGRKTIQQMNVTGQASVERDVVLNVAYMIGGTVTSEAGRPLAKATVQAFSMTNRAETTRSSVETNEVGEFLFDDVSAGVYTLMFIAEGYRNEREPRVETGEMALHKSMTPLPQVRGRVVDALGEPVSDFTVLLRNPVQGTETTMAMPDTAKKVRGSKDGAFILSCPMHGTFVVEAKDKKHAPSFSEPFQIVYGQELTGVVVQLSEGGILRGRVVDAKGQGIGGARVKSHDTEYSDDPFWRSLPAFPSQATVKEVRTNASGDFEFSGLSAATYQVDVRHARFAQTIKTGIVVVDGDMVELPEIQLAAGATISGTVHGPSGAGLSGAMVQLQLEGGAGNFAVNLTTRTDGQGRYTFNHVPAGSYHIHAQRRGNDNPFQGSSDLQKTRKRISVSEGDSYVQEFNISN
jgi:protocatechuate 3,4-dioxygenase beta subunit